MIVTLRIDRGRVWHRRLADRLEAMGHAVVVDLVPGATSGAGWVLTVERRLYRSRSALFEPVALPKAPANGPPQLAISLVGSSSPALPCLDVRFDGRAGEAALVQALLAGRGPVITVSCGAVVLAAGLPAVEDPLRLSRALDQVLSRLITLLAQAVLAFAAGQGASVAVPEGLPARSVSGAMFLTRAVAGKVARRVGPAKGRPDHWRIGYRRDSSIATAAHRAWGSSRFAVLPDDGRRFYADPFPCEEAGRRYVFFEDFPYATMKGVIGVVEIGADNTPSVPRTVLEQPVHLSYPFLIRDGSDIYMLPETSGARRAQLFRADPFPHRWVPDRVLIDDVMVSDATVIQHDGRFWMFATMSDAEDSTWDQLVLFHAPLLFGPWTAHPANPVLIDAGAARPAGAMWHEDGMLMRVAQDCRAGYGGGLAICRVDRLDTTGFAQTVLQRLGPPNGSGAEGVHTLNRCGDLEVIDLRVPHAG